MNVRDRLGGGLGRLRALVRRDGAEQSGLASLMELSVLNAAGDALVTVALAGSLFFAVPTDQARSNVALYLLITMVPFALLAPVLGPLLDRVAYGRRTALAALCLGRGLLAWQLATSLDSLEVYPLALGLLMLSRGFGVARSAVVPRVTPPELTLVKVNSRLSLVNIVAGAVVAPLGLAVGAIPFLGYPWVLRICAVVYMAGVLFAFNLPSHVDSAAGERTPRVLTQARGSWRRRLGTRMRATVSGLPIALRANLVLRGLVGFLTFYLAFLLSTAGGTSVWLAGLAVAAGVGSALGVGIGGRLGRRRPEGIIMLGLLLAAAGCSGAAVHYTRFTSLVAALLVTMAGSMAKLALDAVIQRDIDEAGRNSAFAKSETGLQLAWVAGGGIGLVKLPGTVGFVIAALVAAGTMVAEGGALRRARADASRRRTAPVPTTAYLDGAVGDGAVGEAAADEGAVGEGAADEAAVREGAAGAPPGRDTPSGYSALDHTRPDHTRPDHTRPGYPPLVDPLLEATVPDRPVAPTRPDGQPSFEHETVRRPPRRQRRRPRG